MKTIHIEHLKGQRPYIQLTVKRVEPSVWSILHFNGSRIAFNGIGGIVDYITKENASDSIILNFAL